MLIDIKGEGVFQGTQIRARNQVRFVQNAQPWPPWMGVRQVILWGLPIWWGDLNCRTASGS